ncbi:unnamed protein product [Prorocentrum cordatum]|uniref:Major facilitator superfamily (MFS) profile domain-containing protein n=1 Tax=Prorocentrum cordatum TaxID=2364126 RepID=A0ABN9SCE0_9DINO|nr:unnamed protein product [Polarella glacialis]
MRAAAGPAVDAGGGSAAGTPSEGPAADWDAAVAAGVGGDVGARRALSDVIDDLGLGLCQARVVFFAGFIYVLAGVNLFFITTFSVPIAVELGLVPCQKAALGSAAFAGMFVGNIACLKNDSVGRRRPLLLSMLGVLLFAGASSVVHNFWSLLALWILMGASLGLGVPTYNALCMETTPSDWRYHANAVSMTLFSVATVWGASISYVFASDAVSSRQHWATIVQCSSVLNSLFVVLAVVPGFVESPTFLMRQRRLAEAREQLEAMRLQNGRPDVSLNFSVDGSRPRAPNVLDSFATVFSRAYRPVTLVLGFTTCLLNFISYGQYYALPQVLGSVDLGVSPSQSMLVSTLSDTAGYGLGCVLAPRMGRKMLALTYLVGTGVSMAVFVCGLEVLLLTAAAQGAADGPPRQRTALALVELGFNSGRLFISVGWSFAYTYVGEAFPTRARAGGSGVCIACGRIGSFSAPWVFEALLARTGTGLWYFVAAGVFCVVNAVLVQLVLPETKGVRIDDEADEDASTASLLSEDGSEQS